MSAGQRDYYEVLGLKSSATADEIRAAYRKLVRELHPDVNKAPDAAARFNEVQQAYDTLSDDDKRRAYDRYGAGGPTNPFASGMGGGGAGGKRGTYTWTNVGAPGGSGFGDADVASVFEEIFGRAGQGAGPFGGQARARSRPTRGRDIQQDLPVDFMLAIHGGKQTLRVRRGGATQTVEVTIPAGVAEGAKLRMRGAGAPSANGGPPGDLLLQVRIEPHAWFRRDGKDVLIDLPLSISEAALGATISVPTLSGRAEVTVPAGSSSGQRLRLRGQGLPSEDGQPGDLYVIIKIVAPKDLSDDEKSALRRLGEKHPAPRTGPAWER